MRPTSGPTSASIAAAVGGCARARHAVSWHALWHREEQLHGRSMCEPWKAAREGWRLWRLRSDGLGRAGGGCGMRVASRAARMVPIAPQKQAERESAWLK